MDYYLLCLGLASNNALSMGHSASVTPSSTASPTGGATPSSASSTTSTACSTASATASATTSGSAVASSSNRDTSTSDDRTDVELVMNQLIDEFQQCVINISRDVAIQYLANNSMDLQRAICQYYDDN